MRLRQFLFKIIRIIGRIIYNRRIWLISDRKEFSGDNGEAFFRFLKQKDVDAIFAISNSCPDYERIARIGEVVNYDSLRHKFLLCVCECHCSSHLIHMENHTETPQIFLQHGVNVNNISKMMNVVTHKNFYTITSSPLEYEHIRSKDYCIDPDHVWLTGLPRFDLLHSLPKKKIVIALTWRADLCSCDMNEVKNSDYYKTINALMNNECLYNVLNTRGYELYIKLHPEMQLLNDCILNTKMCKIYSDSYNKMYEESSIMITDYSSSVDDFAYLYKPVVFYQYDKGLFFVNNPYITSNGFDFEKDGIGPVVYTIEELILELKKIIDRGCKVEEKYIKRIDSFFAYHDFHNCERVYQHIQGILNLRSTEK